MNDALNDLYGKLNQKQEEINSINNIGTTASNHILNGYTAYVNGSKITGTIPSKGATINILGTSNQTIASGNYISGEQTIKGDTNLVAADIASVKTAYVNGNKITGTGGGAKVYTFNKVQATASVSNTLKYGTWVNLAASNSTAKFTASLGFTPNKVVACELYLTGNYSSTLDIMVDHDFRFSRGDGAYWYKEPLEATYKGTYMSNSNTNKTYADVRTYCKISGNNIIFELNHAVEGSTSGNMQTIADTFYLSGTLVYQ